MKTALPQLDRLILVGQLSFRLYGKKDCLLESVTIQINDILSFEEASSVNEERSLSDYLSECLSGRFVGAGTVSFVEGQFCSGNQSYEKIVESRENTGIIVFLIDEFGCCEKYGHFFLEDFLQCDSISKKTGTSFVEAFLGLVYCLYCFGNLPDVKDVYFKNYDVEDCRVLSYKTQNSEARDAYKQFLHPNNWIEEKASTISPEMTYDICERIIQETIRSGVPTTLITGKLVDLEKSILESNLFYNPIVVSCFERPWQWLGHIKDKEAFEKEPLRPPVLPHGYFDKLLQKLDSEYR